MQQPLPIPQDIAALIPCYTEKGDCTRLLTTNGSTLSLPVRSRAVLHRLARSRATDLAALRHITALKTQRSILQPLPLAPSLLLIPVKVRTPRITGDTCTGYCNYYAVTAVFPCGDHPTHTTLTLTGGHSITALWAPATIRRYMQLARLTACTPHYAHVQETEAFYSPDLFTIAHKLAEVFWELLSLKHS